MDLLIFLAGIALLVLVGMVLAWPPDEDPPAGRHHRDSPPKAVPRAGKAPDAPTEAEPGRRVWITSLRESGWHVAASPAGGAGMAACGHRLSGPRQRRPGYAPPVDGARSTCWACVHAVGYLPRPRLCLPPTPVAAPEPEWDWPAVDPDEPAVDEPVEQPHEKPVLAAVA